ncbi:unnamed protein product [Vitrella brassicaformis CCMP3155]|uniref:Uncharacterized protein n=1 Tax=Vitrella brassicaformis (strain CCMP3155) TaxID=1169540 RepID=A0A0G4GE86_VITBC|nr:unnamed protein product [Vitrella brassicaformis CCMP3155]|eukprot:CEM27636.1 unnamed protein product [Vitrella brassicaformis CCMP3155]
MTAGGSRRTRASCLRTCGNTCCINAIAQPLVRLHPLSRYLVKSTCVSAPGKNIMANEAGIIGRYENYKPSVREKKVEEMLLENREKFNCKDDTKAKELKAMMSAQLPDRDPKDDPHTSMLVESLRLASGVYLPSPEERDKRRGLKTNTPLTVSVAAETFSRTLIRTSPTLMRQWFERRLGEEVHEIRRPHPEDLTVARVAFCNEDAADLAARLDDSFFEWCYIRVRAAPLPCVGEKQRYPRPIQGLPKVEQLATGFNHTIALADGAISKQEIKDK